MRKFIDELWKKALVELVGPFVKDKRLYLKFTRRVGFNHKVKTLRDQAIKKAA